MKKNSWKYLGIFMEIFQTPKHYFDIFDAI